MAQRKNGHVLKVVEPEGLTCIWYRCTNCGKETTYLRSFREVCPKAEKSKSGKDGTKEKSL